MYPEIILDLSRLLSRVLHPTPTGVDRVEMAYARGLLAAVPDRLHFAAVQPTGIYDRLPKDRVVRFLDELEERWQSEGRVRRSEALWWAWSWLWRLKPRFRGVGSCRGPTVYLQTSPHHLERPGKAAAILRRERARFVCMVHDLIPIQYPEYARAGGAAEQVRRVEAITGLADGIVANTQATLDTLLPYLARAGRSPELRVAHLGTFAGPVRPAAAPAPGRPYFVVLGTIEPRKNHLLLLNLWRGLAERLGPAAPKLMVVGRRGWENEQVVDMLERCPALVGCVEEHGGLADAHVQELLAGARALLLPSFAEGYGMPVSEALALGVPVLCSDLPALREAGGAVPEFLDPLDGPAWLAAIRDLASDDSAIRRAQAERRAGWRPPSWEDHIAILLELLHKVAR